MTETVSTISFSFKSNTNPADVERVETLLAKEYNNSKSDGSSLDQNKICWDNTYRLYLLPGQIFISIDGSPINELMTRPFSFVPESLVTTAYENLHQIAFSQCFEKTFMLYIDETGIQFDFLRKGAVLEMSCNAPLAVDKVFKFDVLQFMNAFARFYESVIVEMLKTYPTLRANNGFIDSIPQLCFMDGISSSKRL